MREISFIDLQAQQVLIRDKIEARIAHVLDHGAYIMGPEVAELEGRLGDFCGAAHVISCANGTDALTLALMAENIGPGDIVFVPAFTFAATAEAPAQVGATPYFVDVREDTFTIDPDSLERGINAAKASGFLVRAVIAVDLFGLPADYDILRPICDREGIVLISDAAQSYGASYNGRRVGTLADYTTTSFFPAKPLGCYGDGGAVFTDCPQKAGLLRSLRVHGKGANKYDNVRIGLNSRLDTLQAAILLEKLMIFESELDARNITANRYTKALNNLCVCPNLPSNTSSAWAQYTICCDDRDLFQSTLADAQVPTAIYYPIPLHQQSGYVECPIVPEGLAVSEKLSERVISLPMHPYLDLKVQDSIIDVARRALS